MLKNKKIFVSIVCGLMLIIPCFVLAAPYTCWCGDIPGGQMSNYDTCYNNCEAQCKSLLFPGTPTCQEVTSPAVQSSSGGQTAPTKLTNPLGVTDLPTLIGRVISSVLGIVGSLALLMFIYGGFLWLTSAGSEQKITQGKNVITWAVIGLAVIFLSYTLVGFVIKGITTGGGTGVPQGTQPAS